MNSLLKYQIEKYLSHENNSESDLLAFIDAVNNSYSHFEDKYKMQQHALIVNSEELLEINEKLSNELRLQSNLIDKLNNVIEMINVQDMPEDKKVKYSNLDGVKLAEFIDKQTEEIIEMNKQREKLIIELESQNEELSDYAYLVSHDLKSPLRSIDTLSAWINEEVNEKEKGNVSESLNLIRGNVEKMDNLISGILNYSTINKNLSPNSEINLNELITELLNSMDIPTDFEIKIKTSLPNIRADKFRIQQLFKNLIENAIKFNDKKVGILQIDFRETQNFTEFSFFDNGKGIEKKYFDKIFKPFQKLENDSNSVGIGLSIAKKIINAYNGKIWVESNVGEGSTFYFTLKK